MKEEALNTYFPIILKHFPNAKKENIDVLCCGNAHTVLLIKNHAFRFPKTKDIEMRQRIENKFSKRFAAVSPLPVPLMRGYTDEGTGKTYQMYKFISGVPFTKELASTLTKDDLIAAARDMGKFLSQLHALPIDTIKELSTSSVQTSEAYAQYFKNIIEEDKRLIGSLLTPKEWTWVEKNIAHFYEVAQKHPFPLKVTHADLLPKHILIDEKTHRLSGVIDFALRIGDPANDFRYFDRYGDFFLKTVYEHYPSVDPYFDERRKFHAGDLLVGYLYLSIQRNDTKEQDRYLNELKEYMTTHPL